MQEYGKALERNDGADNLIKQEKTALVFAGSDITKGLGFNNRIYYLTEADLDKIVQQKCVTDLVLSDNCRLNNIYYSSKDNHNGGAYHYRTVSGLDLVKTASALGVENLHNVFVKSFEGFGSNIDCTEQRFVFAPPKGKKTNVVNPMLAFYESKNQVRVVSEGIFPESADKAVMPLPTAVFGQLFSEEDTNCRFVKKVSKVIFNDDKQIFAVNKNGIHTISLADIVALGINEAWFTFTVGGKAHTHRVIGCPLADILIAMGIEYNNIEYDNEDIINCRAADGRIVKICGNDIAKAFVAWDCLQKDSYSQKQTEDLVLYLPNSKGKEAVLYNLSALDFAGSQHQNQQENSVISREQKAEYQAGDNIADAVFYIAVKDDGGKLHYYYYTMAELEAYNETAAFTYINHSITETSSVIGVLLSNLLADLSVEVNDDWVIQYAEEDGYHAEPQCAVEHSVYKDRVADLRLPSEKNGEQVMPVGAFIAYGVNMSYDTPEDDINNVDDPQGVYKKYKDGSLLRVYRQTSNAGSSVIKYLIGVAISPKGDLLTGKAGCVINSLSSKNLETPLLKPIPVKGLIGGMQWAVKAKAVPNTALNGDKQGKGYNREFESYLITAEENFKDLQVDFYFDEEPYFSVIKGEERKDYTYSDFLLNGVEIPDSESYADYEYYGYNKPMYVRYKGLFLDKLVGKNDVIINDCDGTEVCISAADLSQYFVASGCTQSKKSTNIANYKRVTATYEFPMIIMPYTAEVEFSNEHNDYSSVGKTLPQVAVRIAKIAEIIID